MELFKHIHILLLPIIFYFVSCVSLEKKGNNATEKEQVVIESVIKTSNLKQIARLTGEALPNENILNPNRTSTYDVLGTDLGIMWHIEGDKIGLFFGDTNGAGFQPHLNGGGGNGTNWRSNVLAFSEDTNLEDGLTIYGMVLDEDGKAKEIIDGGKANREKYQTSIPTSVIRVGNTDYVHYMNIYDWAGANCSWLTNFSSIYSSSDNGQSWVRKEEVTFKPLSHFSQVTYAKKNGYVYMIGTRSGRGDAGYLARFKEIDILNMSEYEYWNGNHNKWIKGDENAATVVIPAPVGEASLIFHEKSGRWIITYNYDYACDPKESRKKHAILYRDTDDITSWSDYKVLVSDQDYSGLYCAYLHPLKTNEDKLYFLMSLWGPYNVYLMSVDLEYTNN